MMEFLRKQLMDKNNSHFHEKLGFLMFSGGIDVEYWLKMG